MPTRAERPCTTPGCPELTRRGGRCDRCRSRTDLSRGTVTERGYTGLHRSRFRAGVLAAHPVCRCALTVCPHHHAGPCPRRSVVADHWPLTRRQLVAQGKDPDNPSHGRGLCPSCHGRNTATDPRTRGGWNTP
ncbi:holin [Lentzea tibetensis]|uniref:Holin n=1 Tax=Lentzea tibetensis TaxID=2591470 RepID=A0A563EKB6_9PSEU|nr:holin [Lentzea tibetensis]